MENISLNGVNSRNWTSGYAYPSPVKEAEKAEAADKADQPPTAAEPSKSDLEAKKNSAKHNLAREEETARLAERKRQEAQQVHKKDEEKQAQQNLIQTFYLEKMKIDMSPEKLKESMKSLAERSIESLMSRDGTSLKMEWKSELHKISLEISVEAYDKFNEQADQQGEKETLLTERRNLKAIG